MHLNPFLVYLWLKLDAICKMLTVLTFLGIIAFVILLLAYGNACTGGIEDLDSLKKSIMKVGILTMTFLILANCVPNTKQFATIILLPKIANSKTTKRLLKSGDNISKLLLDYTEQELQTTLNKRRHEKKFKAE